ncbi:ecto-ADP-ribosyltransferase 4 isoform 1-T2 [Odontesthes bonariensis]|uniref:ecto-ADP-ribosyltransferase 4 n=1 Tax=Odontesthes bonariensis TaxID=219752 RepID=UPI003F581B93
MFDRRKLLLAAILFIGVYSGVTVGNKLVDMASDVIDDLYDGCRNEAMEKFITSGLLKQELNSNDKFQKAWNKSTQCPSLIHGGDKDHTSALSVFHFGDVEFLKTVNNEVETMGANITTYEHDFHFKSLHFLLMDSMMLLKPEKCKTVYSFYDGNRKPKIGSTVRFPGFAKVYSSTEDLEDLDGQTLLNITSCFFINLGDHICKKGIGEILISPAEVFTVENISDRDKNGEHYTEVVLKHSALNSTHNCYMFPRIAAAVSTQALVPLLVALSFFSLTL